MKLVIDYFRGLFAAAEQGWRTFWFTPADPATLAAIRVLVGSMLFYSHLVWCRDFEAFFGPQAWLSADAVRSFATLLRPPDSTAPSFLWSYWWWCGDSPVVLWTVHILGLLVFALLAVGCCTRVVSVLAFLAAVSYVNRVPAAIFGLDQTIIMLSMYLMLGPAGDAFSVDRWWRNRRAGGTLPLEKRASANLAIRLIQVHMCIIYFFAGISKLAGQSWWSGTAMWLAFANKEYQSLDMTWLADWPLLLNLLTHLTIAWEVSYAALVWPRWTRPLVVSLAVPLHLGIAFCLGMITFGTAMLFGNLAFVSPELVRAVVARLTFRRTASEVRSAEPTPAWTAQQAREAKPARRR